jgi:polysaccharide pyruvyl transferase WcaK-like protein
MISGLNEQYDVHFLEFLDAAFRAKETLRSLKINNKIPFYNFQRYLTLNKVTKQNLSIDKIVNFHRTDELINDVNARQYDALITAKVVWNILPETTFLNIYWLPKKIKAKKIAYAISGHRTDLEMFRSLKKQVYDTLRDYQLIGVRDKITQIMMEEAGIDKVVPVQRITDPAFFYQEKPIDFSVLIEKYKISKERPILGMLYYGKSQISASICSHYHALGYQIINFNMFNPCADLNIGHRVDVDEWVTLIKHLDFCITDRFHVSVICLREGTPFVAFEPFQPKTLLNSKVFSLLESFNVESSLYQDTYADEFDIDQFISTCDSVKKIWSSEISPIIRANLQTNNQLQREFLLSVNKFLES